RGLAWRLQQAHRGRNREMGQSDPGGEHQGGMRPIRCRLAKPSLWLRLPELRETPQTASEGLLPRADWKAGLCARPNIAGIFGGQISFSASALSPIMCDVTLAVHLARFFLRGLQ